MREIRTDLLICAVWKSWANLLRIDIRLMYLSNAYPHFPSTTRLDKKKNHFNCCASDQIFTNIHHIWKSLSNYGLTIHWNNFWLVFNDMSTNLHPAVNTQGWKLSQIFAHANGGPSFPRWPERKCSAYITHLKSKSSDSGRYVKSPPEHRNLQLLAYFCHYM